MVNSGGSEVRELLLRYEDILRAAPSGDETNVENNFHSYGDN